MVDENQCQQQIGGASGNVSVWNMLSYRVLLMIFWVLAFLVPWLLLVSGFMLKVCEVLTGKVPVFDKKSKDIV
jgi:hypothetical protein